jgi:hypothetical protein
VHDIPPHGIKENEFDEAVSFAEDVRNVHRILVGKHDKKEHWKTKE